jgi:hypothetical protein
MVYKLLILIIETVVVLYFLGYPVLKKRPFFIREFTNSVIVLTLFSMLATFSFQIFYIFGIFLSIFVYIYGRTWFIIGVNIEQIRKALEKALAMTRSEFREINNEYDVKDLLKISINRFVGFQVVRFYPYQRTRKINLIQTVFRKFISNYYISF